MELVWENGQVLVRGLSSNPSCVSYPPSTMNFQAKDDEEAFSLKTRRLDHYSGQEECSKLQNSIQQDHHAGLFSQLYQNDFNLFFENTRKFDGVDSQVVPLSKNASSRNGSKLNPQLTVPELQNQETESDRQRMKMQRFSVPETLPVANNKSRNGLGASTPQKMRNNMELALDEQSQASGLKNNAFQLCPDKVLVPVQASSAAKKVKEKSRDQTVGTTSMGSRASNNMVYSNTRRRHEDNDLTTSPSNNFEEEKTSSSTEFYQRGCYKRKSTEVHNISERKRRAKINKKMRELQELVPNSDKVDKASMLDQAIEYLKTLQIQIQIMQMASSLYTQSMMLPSGMPQLQAPQLGHLFASLGMGMHIGSFGCNPAMYSASSMLGMSGQMMPMTLLQPPCVPFMGGSSILPHSFPGLATPREFLASASPLPSKVSTYDSDSGNNGNVVCSKMQRSSRR